jgi:hypothetical protein
MNTRSIRRSGSGPLVSKVGVGEITGPVGLGDGVAVWVGVRAWVALGVAETVPG